MPDGDLIVGGDFAINGLSGRNIARLRGNTWSIPDGGAGGWGRALASLPNGDLAAGGAFYVCGNQISPFFARLSTTCPATAPTIATSCIGPAGPVTLVADALPWVGSTFRSTATGFTQNAFAVSLLGFTQPNVPLTWIMANAIPGCDQLASHEAILLTLPTAGASSYSFAIPNSVSYAGLPLFHQFLHFAIGPQGHITSLSSSNALALTIGAF